MICAHKTCDQEAEHHLKANHYSTDVCEFHFILLEIALMEAGGYSAANTPDNAYGWS